MKLLSPKKPGDKGALLGGAALYDVMTRNTGRKISIKKALLPLLGALTLAASLFILISLSAASQAVQPELGFNRFNIKVNGDIVANAGESYTLSNGAEVPFSIVYQDTTYVPVRKLGEIMCKAVDFDGITSTVLIDELAGQSVSASPKYFSKSTKMYSGFPSVPNFGAFAGAELAGTNVTEISTNFMYEPGFDVFLCSAYLTLLEEAGFINTDVFENEDACSVHIYMKDRVSVLLSTMHGCFSVIVIPST